MEPATRDVNLPRTKPEEGFRSDINALRALAVIPVVAFHAGMAKILPGGFIGVDVFYAISGFLITGILLRDLEKTGRIDLGRFWAKRLRRLVPALALVIAVTLPVALLATSPLIWADLAQDAAASMWYVSNILFAVDAIDYFAEDLTQSPFLHTWSLGVEEQFYVAWPLLLLLSLIFVNRTKLPVRAVLVILFSAVIVTSLALSIFLTENRPGLAFYLLPTRAWEFAAGGLLAAIPAQLLNRRRTASAIYIAVGISLLFGGFLLIEAADPFPGVLAAVPVAGTLLIIAGGSSSGAESRTFVSKLLKSRPLQWVGRRSYSWYLWHWPVIVLVGTASQNDSTWLKIAAAICSLGLAAITYKYVENRFRRTGRLVASTRLTFLAAGSATVALSVLAGIILVAAGTMISSPPYAKFAAARALVSDQACDRESTSSSGYRLCEMGDVRSMKTVMLIGDSHAGHWKAALSAAASEDNVRLLVRWMSACPVGGLNVLDSKGTRVKGCAEFHAETLAIVKDERPDAVILSQSDAYAGNILSPEGTKLTESEQLNLWRSAFANRISVLSGTGAAVGIIEDNPGTPFDSPLCMTRLLSSERDCTVTRSEALSEPLRGVDAEVVAEAGVAAVYSPTEEICGPSHCRIISSDGVPIYRDRTHLSEQWTKTQAPKLKGFIQSLLSHPQS